MHLVWTTQIPHFSSHKLPVALPSGVQFTFLLNASKELPRQSLPFAHAKSRFRKTVGVRLPANILAQRLLELLDNPLLCSSCHVAPEDDLEVSVEVMTAEKLLDVYPAVDFVLDVGETWVTQGSTVRWETSFTTRK